MMALLASLTVVSSTVFLFLSHPLSFGMILLMQTLIISLITGTMNYNFWFSYILFLVMVGGMLILFIYMTSVASNEKFKFSSKLFVLTISMLILAVSTMMTDKFFSNTNLLSYETIGQNQMYSNSLSLSKFLNLNSSLGLFMIIMYLLITLIMVVKVTDIRNGPLRQKF
uniref:NADH-ubiquinone oxidoreductase chain 6 n=1 Tax=Olethrius laevipennis TaxID=2547836 RepID=A0A6H0N1J4_9CUCU|nr:NADH dehydrogenase subunit 6 [Olethrius laevipennis]